MSTAVVEVLNPVPVTSPEVTALVATPSGVPIKILRVPWRDPHTVSKQELAIHISSLEQACEANPHSPDLRTCLGMAYAMNLDAYRSMDALEAAVKLDETHFFAQLKLSELYYRLRALPKAEEETLKAVNLATNGWELSMARKQLQEIRRLIREGTQKPAWTKPLAKPSVIFVVLTIAICVIEVLSK